MLETPSSNKVSEVIRYTLKLKLLNDQMPKLETHPDTSPSLHMFHTPSDPENGIS